MTITKPSRSGSDRLDAEVDAPDSFHSRWGADHEDTAHIGVDSQAPHISPASGPPILGHASVVAPLRSHKALLNYDQFADMEPGSDLFTITPMGVRFFDADHKSTRIPRA
ncbi:MAG: hypothetical protein Q7K57_58275 [Burkholderiaceae bacterium]|nr:hypothetical protein [Burkholderiaceae bacterium]